MNNWFLDDSLDTCIDGLDIRIKKIRTIGMSDTLDDRLERVFNKSSGKRAGRK